MNPFELKPKKLEALIMNWRQLTPLPYDRRAVDPYTRTRVILMNGTEFEAVWYGHQFSRPPHRRQRAAPTGCPATPSRTAAAEARRR